MIATALNVVKFVSHVELFTECEVGSLRDHSDQVEKFASYSIHIFSFLHKACIAPYFQVLQIFKRIDNNQDKDVCVGPLIKYTVFDAFFGALCGFLLILASLQKSLVNFL